MYNIYIYIPNVLDICDIQCVFLTKNCKPNHKRRLCNLNNLNATVPSGKTSFLFKPLPCPVSLAPQLRQVRVDSIPHGVGEMNLMQEAAHSLNFQSLPQGKAKKPGLPSPTTQALIIWHQGVCPRGRSVTGHCFQLLPPT